MKSVESDRDSDNTTYSHSVSALASKGGQKFVEEKFLPKVEIIKQYFIEDWQEKHILDIGIGYGNFLSLLEGHGFRFLHGMDPFPKSIELSRQFTSADLRLGRIEDANWPFEGHMFDVITSFDVVEHLKEPKLFFSNCRKYLNNDGIIILSTPNKQLPYHLRSVPWIGIPDNNPTHINVNKPGFWIKLAQENDYHILKKWKGEHLTHVKHARKIITKLCRVFRVDPRNVPIINSFEQSLCMVLKSNRIRYEDRNDI
jgi:SAM-dependent methyltransferase